MKTHTRTTRLTAGLATAAALGLALAAAPTAVAQPLSAEPLSAEPAITVNPSTDLPSVARVTVDISGFEPEEAVFAQQCAQVAPESFACAHKSMQSVTLDENGAGTATVTVRRVFEGYDDSSDLVGDIDCVTVELGCFVAVANVEGGTGEMIYFDDRR
ncbi:enediyne antibiotic chromoprotein [Saccharothrix lopnurensis]|uniref:Enediyne antibiotic chromoprotein n=1 Tax=Saccharothrix lopnurensis TaxID=1670621 RepID=A0ABW1PF85_9PSEU